MAKSSVDESTPVRGKIEPKDIKKKFEALQGDADEAIEEAKSVLLVVGAVVAVIALFAVFGIGKRRGNKKMAFIEIRRV